MMVFLHKDMSHVLYVVGNKIYRGCFSCTFLHILDVVCISEVSLSDRCIPTAFDSFSSLYFSLTDFFFCAVNCQAPVRHILSIFLLQKTEYFV